jgi:polysaccharide biosynthesis transport protein
MEILRLYQALLRRKWIVVESVVFFLLAAAAATFLLPKQYVAQSKVIVQSSDTTSSILSDLGLEEVALDMANGSDAMQDKISLATMRPILEDVLWKMQLRDGDDKLLEPEKLITSSIIDDVLARPKLAVTQVQGTSILVLQATSDDAEKSRLMADTFASSYIRNAQEREKEETRQALAFIRSQLGEVQSRLDGALAAIADAQRTEEVIDLDAEVKAAVSRVSDMMYAIEQSSATMKSLQAQMGESERAQEREGVSLVSPSSIAENPQIRVLREVISDLRQKRQAELLEKTEQHPDVLLLNRQIETAERELTLALQEQHELSPELETLRQNYVGEQEKANEIRAGIERLTEQFGSYPDKMRKLSLLKLAADATEKLFQSLQEQEFQIAIAEALTVSDLKFVEPAKKPDKQASPKLLVNLAAGLAVGLMFGIALVFLFEYVDDSIKGPDELREVWQLPQLGTIPRFGKRDEPRLILTLPAHDPVAEAFRTIRNGITYATLDKPPRFIAITSTIPGEGKSTVCVNLAVSMARDGKRVILVDSDFRRPTQHRFFQATNNHVGITNVLLGEVDLEAALQDLPVAGLRLLAAGPLPPDPGRLVESLRMRQILLDVGRICDVVILDTPPVMVVNDAIVLGRQVDQLILVVEAGRASRKVIADVQARLEGSGLHPLGLILNKLDTSSRYGYGGYYKHYRDHYSSRERSKSRAESDADPPTTSAGGAA